MTAGKVFARFKIPGTYASMPGEIVLDLLLVESVSSAEDSGSIIRMISGSVHLILDSPAEVIELIERAEAGAGLTRVIS